MKLFTLFLSLILFTTAGSAYAQFRDQIDYPKSIADAQPTTEMFTPQVSLTDHSFKTKSNFQFLKSRISHRVLLFGTNILANKADFDFRATSLAAYPTTISDYKMPCAVKYSMQNQQVRNENLFYFPLQIN